MPVNTDIPVITIEFIYEHDPYDNTLSVKGIGEFAIVGVASAVSNAIFYTTGHLRDLPMTPDKGLLPSASRLRLRGSLRSVLWHLPHL